MLSAGNTNPTITAADVTAIVLASGRSVRHPGTNKLLRELSGKPLAMHVADTLAAISFKERVAVVAETGPELAACFADRSFSVVRNPDPARGQGHSIALGVNHALQKTRPKALLICLADMPFVPVEVIGKLIDGLNSGATAAICACNGRTSPPALFACHHFDHLENLDGDRGAKAMLDAIPDLLMIEVDPGILRDFDTVQDFLLAEK